jgi:hypothetical protein
MAHQCGLETRTTTEEDSKYTPTYVTFPKTPKCKRTPDLTERGSKN